MPEHYSHFGSTHAGISLQAPRRASEQRSRRLGLPAWQLCGSCKCCNDGQLQQPCRLECLRGQAFWRHLPARPKTPQKGGPFLTLPSTLLEHPCIFGA